MGSPPATSQSSTDARSTTFVTSTIVTSSCGSSDTNCPATTLVTSSPVVLSSWPYEGPYTTSSAVSVPWFTPVSVPSSPIPSMTTVSASSYSSIGQQTTYTRVITVPVTHTLTATTCPSNVAHCPSTGYTSESVYTTEEVRTVLSCEGGCTRAGGAEQCVVRKRSVLIPPKEEI